MATASGEKPDRVYDELARREAAGELIPGSAERLAKVWRRPYGETEAHVADRIEANLDTGMGRKYKNPVFKPDGRTPLRTVLNRHVGRFIDGEKTAEALERAWGAELASRPSRSWPGTWPPGGPTPGTTST